MKRKKFSRIAAFGAVMILTPALVLTPASSVMASQNSDELTTLDSDEYGEFTAEDYEALGLPTDTDTSAAGTAPFSTTSTTSLYSNYEVYTAANGVKGNMYAVRENLTLTGSGQHDTKLDDDYGQTYGGGKFWKTINDFDSDDLLDEGKYGGGYESFLSKNDDNEVIITEKGNKFSGLYAKSVEFSNTAGNDAKKNCIAEIRACGDNTTTKLDGNSYVGGIYLELMSLDSNGNRNEIAKLYPTVTVNQTSNGRFRYLDGDYVQSLESYFDIEAADIDGDGIDEIFTYQGAYRDVDGKRYAIVNMFRNVNGSWMCSEMDILAGNSADFSDPDAGGDDSDYALRGSAVVTFAAGDIDRNGCDDLAVTCSAPNGKVNVADGSCCIYTWNADKEVLVQTNLSEAEDGVISLAGEDGKGMVSANCAFGTFQAYDSTGTPQSRTVDGLIIAGYESLSDRYEYSDENYFSKAAYRFVYYDLDSDEFVVSDYKAVNLESNGQLIVKSAADDSDQKGRYTITLAPLALCAADLKGLNNNVTRNDAVLFAGDIYNNFVCSVSAVSSGLNNCGGHISLCTEHYNSSNKLDQKGTEQVWIGDVVSGAVSGSDRFNESFLAVVGIHRDEDTGKDDDYYWMDLTHYTIDDGGTARTGQEEVIVESNRKNSTYGTWISLSLPDIDKDGIRMSYNSQYKIYTEPEIMAVLQDAPYFKDLQDVYDYLVLGGTGYGNSDSSTYSNGISVDAELGIYLDLELAIGAGVEIEESMQAAASFDYQHEHETTFSSTYESHAGEGDKVVVYTIPVMVYVYDIVNEMTGESGSVAMNASLGSQMSIVSVERYDEVIKDKDRVSIASLLSSKSGYPSTYAVDVGDTFGQGNEHVKRVYDYTEDGERKFIGCISDPGASASQSIECEVGNEYEISAGLKYDLQVGTGPSIIGNKLMVGVAAGLAASYVHGWSNSEGVEFEGTVDNLPAQAGDNYSFSWTLGVNAYESDDDSDFDDNAEAFWIIGYDVRNVVEPDACIVTGFNAAAASSDSITLNWDSVLSEDSQYQYRIGMLSSDKQRVTSWSPVISNDQTSYKWEGLTPDKGYSFVIAVVDQSGNQAGLQSETVNANTFSEGVSAYVDGIDVNNTASPLNSFSSYDAVDGDHITLNAAGNFSGITSDVNYTWYVKKSGSETWEAIRSTGAAGEVSSLDISVTAEDDGNQYRFMVSCADMYLQSRVMRLNVEEGAAAYRSSYKIQKLKRLIQQITASSPVSAIRITAPEITFESDNNADPTPDADQNPSQATEPTTAAPTTTAPTTAAPATAAPTTAAANSNTPKTGDNSGTGLYILLIAAAAGAVLLVIVKRKSSKQ